VVVFEDIHWADAATLDIIKYLGRRINRSSLMLIVTYRTDEVPTDHPLHHALGEIPAGSVTRLELASLSAAAVAILASGSRYSVDELVHLTRGNAFLVTELLAHDEEVPRSLLDSLLSRVGRLSAAVRGVVEQVAVVPGRLELALIDADPQLVGDALDAGHERGLLEFNGTETWFRHEIARRALEETIPASRRRAFHRGLASRLVSVGADAARIVHHAEQGGDGEMLVRFGPLAARQASEAASHREAVAHYRKVLPYTGLFSASEHAEVLLEYAAECYFNDDQDDALAAIEQALELFRDLGSPDRVGTALRWLSRIRWWRGDRLGAETAGEEAIAVLESLAESAELAMAYSNLAQLHMLAHHSESAVTWAEKAIAAARTVGDRAVEAHALNNLGSALVRAGDPSGEDLLLASLELSLAEGLDEDASRAYSNYIWVAIDQKDYDRASRFLEAGLAFAADRKQDGSLYYLTCEQARVSFELGDWAEAEARARWVLDRPQAPGITTLPALVLVAHIQVRRGEPTAGQLLDRAWETAVRTSELQRIGPVAVARAEYSWLRGDLDGALEAIRLAYELAVEAHQPWVSDGIVFWMWRAGGISEAPTGLTEPYAKQLLGDWSGAAAAWQQLGCVYEQASALVDAEEEDPLREALAIFDRLGALPAARLVRRKMKDMGIRRIPRGPRPGTRSNPAGLTNRQVDVLLLLRDGLSNAEIAEALVVSPKTVDHHVSAVLAKLEVSSRAEAAARADALGLTGSPK
jgi:DNA-binding CsgD family transcriptional regulator/tetratricopeptide (TPR) repeat protein